MSDQGVGGIRRIVNACGYSMLGFAAAWRHEAAFRQEAVAAVVLLPLAAWLGADGVERALLVGSVLLVLLVELVNSALEAAVDRFGPERHELVGRAKDLGSAAVFVALVSAAAVWGLILYPHWF